jgi:hypothetical protein
MRIGPGPPVLELGSPSRIPEVSDALPIHELMPLRHFSERSQKIRRYMTQPVKGS